jgi:transposase
MRGVNCRTTRLFSYLSPEALVPPDDLPRQIRPLVNAALAGAYASFDAIYAEAGRPSIPPERLLRTLLLQAFFSVHLERRLKEQLTHNGMFR